MREIIQLSHDLETQYYDSFSWWNPLLYDIIDFLFSQTYSDLPVGNPRIKHIKISHVNYIIMKNHIKLLPIPKSSSESESESESELESELEYDNEETIKKNVIKIQNMENYEISFHDNLEEIRTNWKIKYMILCHCGRYHHVSANGIHDIIELTNEQDKNKENNTSMRSIINFMVNEIIDELKHQIHLKNKTIKKLKENDNKSTIDKLKSEIKHLEIKTDALKELFHKK